MDNEITRFEIPQSVKHFLNVAMNYDVVDVFDVYGLATKHKDNWAALVEEIVLYAFKDRHCNRCKHVEVSKAADAYWVDVNSK